MVCAELTGLSLSRPAAAIVNRTHLMGSFGVWLVRQILTYVIVCCGLSNFGQPQNNLIICILFGRGRTIVASEILTCQKNIHYIIKCYPSGSNVERVFCMPFSVFCHTFSDKMADYLGRMAVKCAIFSDFAAETILV